jgi:hypothetical protein
MGWKWYRCSCHILVIYFCICRNADEIKSNLRHDTQVENPCTAWTGVSGWIEIYVLVAAVVWFAHTDTHVGICLRNGVRFDLFGWCINMTVTLVTRASCPPCTLEMSECRHVAVPCRAPSQNIAPKPRRFSGVDICVSLEPGFPSLERGVWEQLQRAQMC